MFEFLYCSQKPVKYSDKTVPLCLTDEYTDYKNQRSMLPTFLVKKETGLVNEGELRKGERMMTLFSDEKCESELDNGVRFFDRALQVCSVHEPKGNPNEDSQPVKLIKIVAVLIFQIGVSYHFEDRLRSGPVHIKLRR